jgi:hypothetical protein
MFCLEVFAVFYNLFASKKWNGTDALLVALFFLSLMAAHSLYYVEARHRWAVEPLMLAFSANGIVALISIAYETIWNKRETA